MGSHPVNIKLVCNQSGFPIQTDLRHSSRPETDGRDPATHGFQTHVRKAVLLGWIQKHISTLINLGQLSHVREKSHPCTWIRPFCTGIVISKNQ